MNIKAHGPVMLWTFCTAVGKSLGGQVPGRYHVDLIAHRVLLLALNITITYNKVEGGMRVGKGITVCDREV